MKSIKHIALSTMLTLSVFGAILYTSCSKDSCKGVTCLNGGVCSGGNCGPCPTGVGGNNCEIVYRLLYTSYAGTATYSTNTYDSITHNDSSYIIRTDTGNTLVFTATNDSNYAKMQLQWNRPGLGGGNTNILLANNTPTGSTFTASFTIDTVFYSGTGNVSQTSASLNLVGTHAHGPSIVVTLDNFSKQ